MPELNLRAEQIVAAILRDVDLGGGPVECTLVHGPSEIILTLRGQDPAGPPRRVEVTLYGDLPEAEYLVVADGMAWRGRLAVWMDHTGSQLLGPAPTDNPTGFGEYDRLTHRIMRPQPGQLIQAVSWCGRRVHEVPGRGPIDCPECLALIAEDQAAQARPAGQKEG